MNISLSPVDRTNIKQYDKRRKKKFVERGKLMERARAGDVEAIKRLKKEYHAEIK